MILVLFFLGCTTASKEVFTSSNTNDVLRNDTLRLIKQAENAASLAGDKGVSVFGMPEIVSCKTVEFPQTDTDKWVEIRTVQRNGYTVEYKITFTPTPDLGGCDIQLALPAGSNLCGQ